MSLYQNSRTATVLFREKNWEIHKSEEEDNDNWSQIIHYCTRLRYANGFVPRSYLYEWDFECPHCDALAPDDVQTLWQMHNFDRVFNS